MSDTASFEDALGQRVRELRQQLNLTADDVAQNARLFGLNWRRTTVSAIEAGRRNLMAKELLLLPMILVGHKRSGDRPFDNPRSSLGEILDFDAAFNEDLVVTRSAVAKVLRGEVPDNLDVAFPKREAVIKDMYEASPWSTIKEWWPDVDVPTVDTQRYSEVESAASRDTEMKAAERLDLDPLVLSSVAFRCWGQSFSDERDQRTARQANPESSTESRQAVRGRVTRQLLEEVQIVLNANDQGGDSEPSH